MAGSEPPIDQRMAERVDVSWAVDCETEDTFLFASITNISQMGIFVRTDQPLPIGTFLKLSFAPHGAPPFTMRGRVQWLNNVSAFGDNINPGMGIMFIDMGADDRERLVSAIRTIAYLRGDPPSN
jgi:type IV pilus assembly protein PilZ